MRKVLLLGDPVEHSLSPAMHNAGFRVAGLDLVYEARRVERDELREVMGALRTDAYAGANVTIPHKEAALTLADSASAEAHRIGAANTLVRRDDRLHADNTDGYGFREALAERHLDIAGRRVLLLGAGGGARACALELLRAGARVGVASRTPSRVAQLVADFGELGHVGAVDWPRRLAGYGLLVNATPLGLHGEDPLDGVPLGPPLTVFDLVPTAAETPLLRRARDAGCVAIDGLLMLLHQAAASFRIWTGRDAPVEAMRAALPRRV